MAHVKWLTIMVPICLCFPFSSVAKENSTAIINPGPNPQEVQSSTAPLLALPLPQHFPGQHSGHGIGGSSHTTALGSSPLVSPLTAAPRTQQGIPWGQGPQGQRATTATVPAMWTRLDTLKCCHSPLCPRFPGNVQERAVSQVNHKHGFKCSSLFGWVRAQSNGRGHCTPDAEGLGRSKQMEQVLYPGSSPLCFSTFPLARKER